MGIGWKGRDKQREKRMAEMTGAVGTKGDV
jgi:hypothetical protein